MWPAAYLCLCASMSLSAPVTVFVLWLRWNGTWTSSMGLNSQKRFWLGLACAAI